MKRVEQEMAPAQSAKARPACDSNVGCRLPWSEVKRENRHYVVAVHGDSPLPFGIASSNHTYLVRRIAWRLQAIASGELSERARARADAL
jgi:hypothetical protein